MKPISARHKYALRYEMTTDALNFRELAFRQTSPHRPHAPLGPTSHLQSLAPSGARSGHHQLHGRSREPGRGAESPPRAPPEARADPQRAAPPPTPAGQVQATTPLARFLFDKQLGLSPWRSRRQRDGYLHARLSSWADEKDPGAAKPPRAFPAAGPGPHTHARICTRARAQAHTRICTPWRTDTPARAHARTHSGL